MFVHFHPFRELSRLEKEMNTLLGAATAPNGDRHSPTTWNPPVDVYEDAERILLVADLPGIDQKDLEISIEKNVLTVRGARKAERDDAEGYHRLERVHGVFARTFTLPNTVDAERVGAELKNGVLVLTLPKRPEAQPKQIKVQVS